METEHKYYLVLDLGTTNAKAFVFDDHGTIVARVSTPLSKFIHNYIVEQDPTELVQASKQVLREAVSKSGIKNFTSFGITTQRETTIAWDSETGKPFYSAIVWEDQRTKEICKKVKLKDRKTVREKTGLTVDPYFSATKMFWLLQNVPEVQTALRSKRLKFGTPDSWLLFNFLQGQHHLTDHTNAARTLLFNIQSLMWDADLLSIFHIPQEVLPKPKPSISAWGVLKKDLLGFEIPVKAVCGDQQASLYAAGTNKGTTKITYGTGTFVMQIIGAEFALAENFFTTLACSNKQPIYVLEAKVSFGAKQVSAVLKDQIKLKAVLEQLAIKANKYIQQLPIKPQEITIDGGITQAAYLAQIQAQISHVSIKQQKVYDGTALGVANLLMRKE